MEHVIWKFTVDAVMWNEITMPRDAGILTAQWQAGKAVMWAIVNPEAKTQKRKFLLIGTGWNLPKSPSLKYVATMQDDGGFVWHLFEVRETTN